ncbi:WG repeat-containing protein [uncultured Duncaniella sp.]|uniref:WG repeat-containing protein n=1 Tax=uncultured Duncaniella sp. TaxID=2768039 RepID=UPI0034E93AAB
MGYADEQGNTVITPRFVYGFPFENGKARVADYGEKKEVEGSNGECHYWESDGWYYIDKTGRKLEN